MHLWLTRHLPFNFFAFSLFPSSQWFLHSGLLQDHTQKHQAVTYQQGGWLPRCEKMNQGGQSFLLGVDEKRKLFASGEEQPGFRLSLIDIPEPPA